jgi:hypothetical protein
MSPTPSGGAFQGTWTSGSPAITSSSVTATVLGPLQPLTTYQLTVVSTDNAGSGPASDPVTITTAAAAVVPGAPTAVTVRWAGAGPWSARARLGGN